MSKELTAHGEAAVRLTDQDTGRVVREVSARNKLNSDYVAEIKNNLFSPTSALTLFLSEYDQSPPDNGLIFPMGRFLGFGRYNTGSSTAHQGVWNAVKSKVNHQVNGLTSSTFAWDFTPSQAVGVLRSLFLYWDAAVTRYPAINAPTVTWRGTPRCSFENKLYDTVARTATEYYVGDYFSKELTLRRKADTLTISGLAYDPDTKHIFVFDSADKKIYEYASLGVDMTPANALAIFPCTNAAFIRGLVRDGNLFYISGSANPASTNASFSGPIVYMYSYSYTTDGAATLVDTMTCAEAGYTALGITVNATFMDDVLVYYNPVSSAGPCAPILRLIDDVPWMGITGVSTSSSHHTIQRPSPNKQIMMAGNPASQTINSILPMAISHLVLPDPFVKDNTHGLTVSYTISIQE